MLNKKMLTTIDDTDTVVVYPSIGRLESDGDVCRIELAGTVYESGSVHPRKQLMLRMLQRVAKVQPREHERPLFEERVRGFIAPTERGKRVAVRVGDDVHRLQKKTKRNGQFKGTLRLSGAQLRQLEREGFLDDGWLALDVVRQDGDVAPEGALVNLLADEGTSVISDIDDTIKVTDVHCRRSLLTNTFLREFQPIEGMASLYQQWARQGAAFHYVSSSPWQLYESLAGLCDQAGFPRGSFHLRSFRLRDHVVRRLLLIRRRGKAVVMRRMMKMFPQRRFVLVGDAGERDPEIYAKLARKYPEQVAAIFIRELPERRFDAERRSEVFRDLEAIPKQVFGCPSELPTELPQ